MIKQQKEVVNALPIRNNDYSVKEQENAFIVKCFQKNVNMPEYITDELEILSVDDRKDSDYSDEENFNEESTFP